MPDKAKIKIRRGSAEAQAKSETPMGMVALENKTPRRKRNESPPWAWGPAKTNWKFNLPIPSEMRNSAWERRGAYKASAEVHPWGRQDTIIKRYEKSKIKRKESHEQILPGRPFKEVFIHCGRRNADVKTKRKEKLAHLRAKVK